MKRKRFLIAAIAFVLSVLLCACNGGAYGGEVKFNGTLSEQSYLQVVEAAKAFLSEEIMGEKSSIDYVSYQKSADLTEQEYLALGIEPAEVKNVEKGVVKYSDRSENGISVSKEHELYFITQLDGTIRYFTPPSRIGEMITHSEYEQIFRQDNFTHRLLMTVNNGQKSECILKVDDGSNCSMEIKTTTSLYGNVASMYMYADIKDDKFDSIYIEYEIISSYYESGRKIRSEYIEFNDGTLGSIYMDKGDGWKHLTLSNYDGIINEVDMLQKQLQQEMTDYMYPFEMLVRTNYGYALSEDKLTAYYKEIFPSITEAMSDIFEDMISEADIMQIEYKDLYSNLGLYVKDGLVSECKGKLGGTVRYTFNLGYILQDAHEIEMIKSEMKSLGYNCEFDNQGNLNMLSKIEATYQGKFYDYGVTEITKMDLPVGLKQCIAQNE